LGSINTPLIVGAEALLLRDAIYDALFWGLHNHLGYQSALLDAGSTNDTIMLATLAY